MNPHLPSPKPTVTREVPHCTQAGVTQPLPPVQNKFMVLMQSPAGDQSMAAFLGTESRGAQCNWKRALGVGASCACKCLGGRGVLCMCITHTCSWIHSIIPLGRKGLGGRLRLAGNSLGSKSLGDPKCVHLTWKVGHGFACLLQNPSYSQL